MHHRQQHATEPYILGVDGRTFPVYFTDGVGDHRLKITIVSVAQRMEHYLYLPETTVGILASAAKCDVASHAFKEFLIGHICLRKQLRKDTFFLGQTRFTEASFHVDPPLADGDDIGGIPTRRMVTELGDVLRLLSDQRCFQERQIWSNQQLFDALTKGFEHMQTLAASFLQQEHLVKKLAADLDMWKAASHERTLRIDSTFQQQRMKTKATRWLYVLVLEAQLSRVENATETLHRAMESMAQQMQSAMHEIHQTRDEMDQAWRVKQKTVEMETDRAKKEWHEFRVDNKRHLERIKDAFGLLNEAQSRSSKQVVNLAGQVNALSQMKDKVELNGQVITEVRHAYLEILPKLQDMVVLERKREAIAAVHNLAFDKPSF
ncbi:Aste57867_10516 [Aphanomyces stellatus]|uniref:Aste57867_10516 protein n=1 Tax=Aphanomyces stellatus TaxID=120398 RepID=A0A485KR10_9STRA|nr:hypothetical protein As57867_010476 [Aphanomyces stellatus]VFT87389.1 Aste57867_10516 [Aphanomyces stellatus]